MDPELGSSIPYCAGPPDIVTWTFEPHAETAAVLVLIALAFALGLAFANRRKRPRR